MYEFHGSSMDSLWFGFFFVFCFCLFGGLVFWVFLCVVFFSSFFLSF